MTEFIFLYIHIRFFYLIHSRLYIVEFIYNRGYIYNMIYIYIFISISDFFIHKVDV
jgi:hypothetical protein